MSIRTGGQLLLVLECWILNDGEREIFVVLVQQFPILLSHLLDDDLTLLFGEVNFIEMRRNWRGLLF